MTVPRLLISYAHPDDESFGLGGLIASLVAQGVQVSLICATNGDVGTVAPEMMNGYNSVAELRLSELECAAAFLRLTCVYKLGFKDSGMMGSATSLDAACLWQAPQDVVTRRVVEVMRELRPQVVITFNKYGGYGHPDHIAIQRATTEAFTLAGDPAYITDGRPAYAPQKLYYSNVPKRQIQLMMAIMRMRGINPRAVGKNKDIDVQAIVEHAEPIHTLVDIRRYYDAWDAASRCHKSQLGGGAPRLPLSLRKIVTPFQGFTRVYPAPKADRVDEYDLFAGVELR
jgi:N-acetyl-1-D-myo-inositol-2-amino-2-deoxy-alpha-D-glucopyranoside deacetylase/mycothiol S-conjugate amidase